MAIFNIKSLIGREIIDSRGNPTLEICITLDNDITQYASVPSGASVGLFEAVELRDCDMDRYNGMGVTKSIKILKEVLEPKLKTRTFSSLKEFDDYLVEIDNTNNKSKIGSNTSLALSLAFAKCIAISNHVPMYKVIANEYQSNYSAIHIQSPIPMLNIINGGKHADNGLMLQEFMIVPIMEKNTKFSERLRLSCEFFADLRDHLQGLKYSTNVGDEGGFAPMLSSTHDALDMIMTIMSQHKYEQDFKIAIDAAASTFYDSRKKIYKIFEDDEPIHSCDAIDFYEQLIADYPIMSIEDAMSEEDIKGWVDITQRIGDKVMLVGDDLFVTNTEKLKYGIENKLGNAILIKPNQIGTITETMKAVHLARENNYEVIVSHRSGETEDISLSHIAVGVSASFLKAGAPCRSERVAKYNELIRIFE